MMRSNLIHGQHLIDSFLKLLPQLNESKGLHYSHGLKGAIPVEEISESVRNKLPDIFNWQPPQNDWGKQLFSGNTSMHKGDHSSADMAFTGYLFKNGLTPYEADQVFRASGLYRSKWDELRGEQTYGERTIGKVYNFRSFDDLKEYDFKSPPDLSRFTFGSSKNYKPIYVPNGMAPRRFVGPQIADGIRLFPERALSSLVALGAVGKTSILLSIGCHIAAGKNWNDRPLQKQKVAMFFCEETQEEISRKFSAITDSWTDAERRLAESNLITIPLLGIDARLTSIERGQYKGSGIAEKMINLLNEFDLKDGLIILDHIQGFTAGDQNLSETATAICREANKIVDATGGAVVMAAHISKANINAKEVEQGFAVGSLAFENATRQMSGMITMPPEDARKFGLEDKRKEYVRLSLGKNSYGASGNVLWLKKVVSPKYHTVVLKPVHLSPPIPVTEMERIKTAILETIINTPNITRNQLDKLSGTKGRFKCSKAKTRQALEGLISEGRVIVVKIDAKEREMLGLPKQTNEVLRIFADGRPANKPAEVSIFNFTMADLEAFEDMD